MSDVTCPYCKKEQEINHDDGYGLEEGEKECTNCGKLFGFSTMVTYSYEVFCSGDHDMEQSEYDKNGELWDCKNCDHYELRR